MGARESECQISQNYILLVKFSEFYLYFYNSCEIWHSFSLTLAPSITLKWLMLERVAVSKDFRLQMFYFALLRGYFIDYNTLQKQEKPNRTTNYINHERWNVCSDQKSLGCRVGHYHVQLTGVDDICIKLQVTYNGERKVKSAKRRTYDFK